MHWDIFCRIVDNYGDIGVCWRLARQLAHEHGLAVRLWIDDIGVAKRLIGGLDVSLSKQIIDGVEICLWPKPLEDTRVADVVIEAFACELPQTYLATMAEAKPVWLNLEYLSAEQWTAGSHLLASRHPALPLTKYFYFPGFTVQSGGLIREHDLIQRRDAFRCSSQAKTDFWGKLGLTDYPALKVSLFCYPHAPLKDLLEAIAESSRPTIVYVPDSSALPSLEAIDGQGNLTLQALPFLTQDDYDRLLWACDINFVRGEDSWVRALWAAKPMIWQPYRQEQSAHLSKLRAFLEFYSDSLPTNVAEALYQIHAGWSSAQFEKTRWQALLDNLPAIQTHATRQSEKLALLPDLAAKLVIFCKNLSK